MGHRFPMANKSFGQHFLNSPTVIKKITSPLPEGVDAIVEIGPGPAVLTPHLAAYKKPIFVIEMDERFVELLAPVVGADNIFRQDALLFDWKAFLEKHNFKSIWLVSNLPYNVSVPLTLSFLRIPEITHMTLMYQKEVAQKILPNDPRNAMGSLHAMCLSQFELQHVVYAPPGAFVPPPKVDSQVLGFKRKANPDIPLSDIDSFESYLRLAFGQRRKQLGGILKNDWGAEKTQTALEKAQISPQIRAEALSYAEVLKLFASSR
ncbi:16S rRNA (adenine(1518)-N(6)/adenine(1519)-N(6))-dimethyltransferase RsmA [Peredibacter starrii]|uniref:16S rRNA (Adenine(1518)-N(6)/adenine(1519)-N(6))-dimethyltransferase RsmA n=1 Tax=Peredibacter starrii TaxID=28202 RepID=A0AAX4HSH9_9BACT|nr:16S rRNA (adenine(1518)-N(6)/adenine(1519)-N(6))-dimethyltransferase RsmA [Peredibacter starrii]WPU66254.1 16S rRNA (adenine(1518)-N(6)/adenine(1519)-N(6))-dimethyltransferase RsmA [Peredibacter starrii]